MGSTWAGPHGPSKPSKKSKSFRKLTHCWKTCSHTHTHITARPGSPSCRLRVPPASRDRNQTPETRLLVNFARLGTKTEFLMTFLDDSAWFCVEELKKHVFQCKK